MGTKGHRRRGGTREAIQRLNAARAELAAARAALAAASVVGQQPARSGASRLLDAHRRELLAVPGVVGVGIGLGARREPRIAVFVQPAPAATHDWIAITQMRLTEGRALPFGIDVIAFTGLAPQPVPTAVVDEGWLAQLPDASTLTPGDGVGQVSPATRGTLGVFGSANDDDAIVGITAMHVIEHLDQITSPIAVVQRDDLADPGARAGEIDRGTRKGVDAARIRLAPGVAPRVEIPTIGAVRGWRPAIEADIGPGVSLYGATSGHLDGAIKHVDVDFPAFKLAHTLLVEIPTEEGDSGAALVDSDGYVLGFLVGASNLIESSQRIFSPVGLVLASLDCNIP